MSTSENFSEMEEDSTSMSHLHIKGWTKDFLTNPGLRKATKRNLILKWNNFHPLPFFQKLWKHWAFIIQLNTRGRGLWKARIGLRVPYNIGINFFHFTQTSTPTFPKELIYLTTWSSVFVLMTTVMVKNCDQFLRLSLV